jgi:hypothetical protein
MKISTYIGSIGNKRLWNKFLSKCLSSLLPCGCIGFITPANWRRPEHKLYNKMTKQNQLLYLHIYSKQKGLNIFRAQTRFDVYVIKNSNALNKFPIIIDEMENTHTNLDLSLWSFLPNFAYTNIAKFLTKKDEIGSKVIYDSSFYDARKLIKFKKDDYNYSIVHTLTKKGIGLRYSNKEHPHIRISKVTPDNDKKRNCEKQ